MAQTHIGLVDTERIGVLAFIQICLKLTVLRTLPPVERYTPICVEIFRSLVRV